MIGVWRSSCERRRGSTEARGGGAISAPARAALPGGSLRASSGAGPGLRRPRPAAGSLLQARQGAAGLQWRAPPGSSGAPLLLPGLEPGRARRAGAPELRASAAFPGRADVNSFLPGGEGSSQAGSRRSRPASAASPEGGVPGRLAGGPRRYGEHGPGASPISSLPTPVPGRTGSLWAAQAAAPHEGSSGPTVAFATRILSPAPRLGGRPLSTWGPGGDRGLRGPHTGPGKPRRPAGRVGARRSGEPGRPGVSQKSPCLITHSRAAECDRSLLNLPIRDEISPSNLDGLHSIKQK